MCLTTRFIFRIFGLRLWISKQRGLASAVVPGIWYRRHSRVSVWVSSLSPRLPLLAYFPRLPPQGYSKRRSGTRVSLLNRTRISVSGGLCPPWDTKHFYLAWLEPEAVAMGLTDEKETSVSGLDTVESPSWYQRANPSCWSADPLGPG